jgi:hypothetical protein
MRTYYKRLARASNRTDNNVLINNARTAVQNIDVWEADLLSAGQDKVNAATVRMARECTRIGVRVEFNPDE